MPSRSEEKVLRALHRRKGREEHGLFLVEGPRLLREALGSGLELRKVFYTEAFVEGDAGEEGRELLGAARAAGAAAEPASEDDLAAFSDAVSPQGVLAVAAAPRAGWDDLPGDGVLLFDAVQDPGNLGTLIRTAEALGMGGAVSLKGTVDTWNPKVTRAAAGSTFRLPVVEAGWEEAEERLRERGFEIWASDPLGEPVAREERRPSALALVLGNEGRGVSRSVLDRASRTVRVPVTGPVDSLNVAVAGALLVDRIFGEGLPAAGRPAEDGAR